MSDPESIKSTKQFTFGDGFVVGCAVSLLIATAIVGFVVHVDRKAFEREAVKAGAATHTSDENGNPIFKWNSPDQKDISVP